MSDGKFVFLSKLSAKILSSIDRVCLPVQHLKSDKELLWFAKSKKEAISYINSNEINNFLKIYFPDLKVKENEEYQYNIKDVVFIITPHKRHIKTFADVDIAVIYEALYEC